MRETSTFGLSMLGVNSVTTTYGPDVPSFILAVLVVGLSGVTMHRAWYSRSGGVVRTLATGLAIVTLLAGLLQVWNARPHKVTVDVEASHFGR
jgi:hypothetical protein